MQNLELFLQPETREGFFIRSMMKRVWACQMDILGRVDTLCKKYDIAYYANCGTLLGAVRHKGYIPWDDDIDIEMLRSEYEKFLGHIDELQETGLLVLNARNGNMLERVMHIVNTDYIHLDPEWLERWYGCPYIVGIDVFILDNVPDDPDKEEQWKSLTYAALCLAESVSAEAMLSQCTQELQEGIRQFCDTLGFQIHSQIPIQSQLFQLNDYLAAMYQEEETERICVAEWPQNMLKREWYATSLQMPFEQVEVPAPCGFEQVLCAWYGKDWRTPVRNGATHRYPGYQHQERLLKEHYQKEGMEVPAFFDVDDTKG